MSREFLFFATLTLLLRLRLLLVDEPAPARAWGLKCAIEWLALGILTPIGAYTVAAAAMSLLLNAGAIICNRRVDERERSAVHLILGTVHLIALSVCFGPTSNLLFRPSLADAAQAIAAGSALGPAMLRLMEPRILLFVLGLLLAANEANLFIRWILGRLQFRPGVATKAGIDANEYARGRVIGLLERSLIYVFVLGGHFGAVGFTLAAKAFTRFKELENRSFAEYVLIGTLLSSALAMLIAVAVRSMT